MIFYFSGNGNSGWVAKCIAAGTSDSLLFIPDAVGEYTLEEGEPLGFVFPTYAWGVPAFVEYFVSHLRISNVNYVYFVTTCGDDTGMTSEIFCNLTAQRGWKCSAGFAVRMPETYVCLPGFHLDTEENVCRKYAEAENVIGRVVKCVLAKDAGVFDTIPGPMPWLKSKVVRPIFNKLLVTARPFHTNDKCISCEACVKQCAFGNIKKSLKDNKPEWGKNCVTCLKCYHSCPQNAIEWGPFTKNRGQYKPKFPEIR